MPYTYTSVALVWLVTLALLVLTASGMVTGPWLLLTIGAALGARAIILRKSMASTVSPAAI